MNKIAVVVASRANYARIKSVLTGLQEHPNIELQVIAAASALLHRYGSAIDVMRRNGFEPTAQVQYLIEGETPQIMAKSVGLAIIEMSSVLDHLKPDAVITVADRFETLATAVAASYMNIPVVHTQGGEVTGSIDESVRHAITKLAHIHFPATQLAQQRLLRMGEDPRWVFHVGCPAIDLITQTDFSQTPQEVVARYGGTGSRLDLSQPYLLVLQHPVTTEYGDGMRQIEATIEAVRRLKMQTVMLWPNADAGSEDLAKGIRCFRERDMPDFIHFYRNFDPQDFLVLMQNCSSMIGNSSSAIREGAFLGMPAVNIGTRQQNRERGQNVIDVDYSADQIVTAVRKHLAVGRYPADHLYGDGRAGQRMAEILGELSMGEVPIQKVLHFAGLHSPERRLVAA